MPRVIPPTSLAGLMAAQTDLAYIALLTISHDGGTEWLTSDSVDTSYGGQTYIQYPFDIILPDNVEGQVQAARLVIDNVERRLIDELRSQSTPMGIQIDVVSSDGTSAWELVASFTDMVLRSVDYTVTSISGRITSEDFLSEPYPKDTFNQRLYPGLFVQPIVTGDYPEPVDPPSGEYTDFSEYVGTSLWSSDWREEYAGEDTLSGANGSANVIADGAATGGAILEVDITTAGRGVFSTWEKAGSYQGIQEILVHGRYEVGDDELGNGIGVCVTDVPLIEDPGNEIKFYGFGLSHQKQLVLWLYTSGTTPDIPLANGVFLTINAGDDYWLRLRADVTTGLIYAKGWTTSYASEPGSWSYNGVSDSTLTGGRLGIMPRAPGGNPDLYQFDEFAYATGGGSPAFP